MQAYGREAGAKLDQTVCSLFFDICPPSPTSRSICQAPHLSNLGIPRVWAAVLTPVQVAKSQAELHKAKVEAEAYAKDAKAATLKEIDHFDKKVEDGAAKAKSDISSWFGAKK